MAPVVLGVSLGLVPGERLAVVGPTTLFVPTSRVRMRPIVPLPDRRGPTSSSILCCDVSAMRQ